MPDRSVSADWDKSMEERVGFEPTIPIPRDNGFQDRRIRPLCHLSKTYTSYFTLFLMETSVKRDKKIIKELYNVPVIKTGLPAEALYVSWRAQKESNLQPSDP